MSDFRRFSSFDARQRKSEFRDDPAFAELLQAINEHLIPLQRGMEQPGDGLAQPVVLVVGLPRSGSTLLTQLMPARLDIAYVSNLMARFHRAPAVGASLQQQLIGARLQKRRQFESRHGVTSGIEEPHEFGYFWARHFDVGADSHEPNPGQLASIDVVSLSRELQSVSAVFRRPWSCKCVIGAGFLPLLAKLPNIFVVHLARNALDVAMSIMRVRQERMNHVSTWWSWRPAHYAKLRDASAEVQVAGQIAAMRHRIDTGLAAWPVTRKAVIHYEALIADPERELLALRDKLAAFAARSIHAVGEPLKPLQPPRRSGSGEVRRQALAMALAAARDRSV